MWRARNAEFRFLSFVLNAFPSTLPPINNGCSTRRKGEDKTREDKTMNYASHYWALISKRLDTPLDKKACYCEKHHIIPRSEGGKDEPDNLVNLTAREHFVANRLLAHIYDD